jgi:hypothetical protein
MPSWMREWAERLPSGASADELHGHRFRLPAGILVLALERQCRHACFVSRSLQMWAAFRSSQL